MKRILFYIFMLTLLPVTMQAKEYSINDVPNVRRSDARLYVTDPEKTLSASATDSINGMLFSLEKKTGIETVVAVLPSIGEEDCFDFAYSLGRLWGVGKKKNDNGLVILLVLDQRKVQFATGYGLEGDLPDAICKRIQMRAMVPSFKHNDWDTGLVKGVQSVCGRLDGTETAQDDEGDSSFAVFFILILFIAIGFIIFAYFKNREANRCPHCGKHQLQRSGSYFVGKTLGVRTEKVIYTCRNCGHQIEREQKSYDDHGFWGPFIGGYFGGGGSLGGSGGGFSGGSFGGGSFGGGGAGSGF